ncbi:hypothetical protein Bca4012_040689 [Brassica carinata]
MTNTGRQLWAGAEEIGLEVWYFGGKEEVPYEDLPRSDKRRKTTRNKKEEDVVRRRGRGKECEGGDGSKLSYENKEDNPKVSCPLLFSVTTASVMRS